MWSAAEKDVNCLGMFRQIEPQKKAPPAPELALAGVEETLVSLRRLEAYFRGELQNPPFVG